MKVQIGQEVGYACSGSYGCLSRVGFGRVTKINGHGHIFLDTGKQFNKYGSERDTVSLGVTMWDAEELRAIVEQNRVAKERVATVKSLISKLTGSFSYSGTVHIDSETKAQLTAMIASL